MTIENNVPEKEKKSRTKTEDILQLLLNEQYKKIEQMIDQKLDHYNYRMYNSFKSEFRRWYDGYYDQHE